jgi:leader peptidase (prepilin peptidase) / N-methyltransferase
VTAFPTVLLACLYGAAIASFLCVVSERVPAGGSINGRSACVCGRQLSWYENVPVAAWLALRGRARCCGARIPARYVLAELALGAAWGLCAALLPPLAAVGAGLAASGLLVAALVRSARR